jgi:hypothetical protein
MSDGTSQDATTRAIWFSSSPSVLSIDESGVATAHERGDTRISATFANRVSTKEVVVVPAGSYRLTGLIMESNSPVAPLVDALVEVVAGTGAGLSTRTFADGRYRLYGVGGDIRLRVIKDGYQPRDLQVSVTDHATQDIELALVNLRQDFSGTYTMTITAAAACRDELPEAIMARTYAAELTQNGALVEARLSGASFHLSHSGRGDNFRGRVQPDGLAIWLTPHAYKYYGYASYPDIAEKLPEGRYFAVEGSLVLRGSRAQLSGALTGTFKLFTYDPAWGGRPTIDCDGDHEVVLSRIGG